MFEAHDLAMVIYYRFKFDGRSERKIEDIQERPKKEIKDENIIVIKP